MAYKYPLVTVKGNSYWTSVYKINEMSKKYQLDVCNLSKEAIETLKGFGVQIKNKEDERGDFVTAKSVKIQKIIDGKGAAWDPNKLIGNGTKIEAVLSLYDHPMSSKYGTGVGYIEVRVKELVEYNPSPSEIEEDVL